MKNRNSFASLPPAGAKTRRSDYADSIMVADEHRCALCGARDGFITFSPLRGENADKTGYFNKLDRHEPWGGANRQKSKRLGLWVPLCHLGCHEGPGGVHADPSLNRRFRAQAQRAAMETFGWSKDEFIFIFGKSEIACAAVSPSPSENPTTSSGFRVLCDEPDLPF